MMKTVSILILMTILLWSCEKESSEGTNKSLVLRQNIELNVGDCVSDDAGLKVCIDSVSDDSRCPSDVVCIWEGNAAVNVSFTINSIKHELSLNTNNSANFPSDTTVQQYHIQLKELTPYPISTSTINQKDYKATLVVEELED